MTAERPIAIAHPYHWDDVRRGGERYVADLGRFLADAGYRVEVILGTTDRPRVEVDGYLTVRRIRHLDRQRLRSRGLRPMDTFGIALLPHLVRRRYRLLHATTPLAALAGRLTGHRTLYTVLGYPTPDQFGHRPGDRGLFEAATRAAHHTVAFSEAAAAAVTSLTGHRCGVLPLGVRLERFPLWEEPRTGAPRLFFAGYPGEHRKRLRLAIDALPAVRAVYPEARLLVPGDPCPLPAAVSESVDFLGVLPAEEMPRAYASATVSVLPSVQEALGIALVESLACGTPVVCADDAGAAGIVGPHPVGAIFAADDRTALVSAILTAIRLAADTATPRACAARAAAWDWKRNVGPQHEQVYHALAGGR